MILFLLMKGTTMKQRQCDKIINFLEYAYLCAKRQYILENTDPMLATKAREFDNKILEELESRVKEDMDILTYTNLIKARMVLEYKSNLTSQLQIADNPYDKTMRDISVMDKYGNLIVIHILLTGGITVAGKFDIEACIADDVNNDDISKYLLILGNYLKSYLQGNDQQDMYLSILDTIRLLDPLMYTYHTPRFKELTDYAAFFSTFVIENDKFFPCDANYRKNLFVLDEIEDENYYVYIKSLDKLCTIKYSSDNKSLSFSLSELDE